MGFFQIGEEWRNSAEIGWKWRFLEKNHYEIVSQKWGGVEWRHTLKLYEPSWKTGYSGGCSGGYLEVSGDDAGEVDDSYGQELAEILGLPVAVLFQVPNQPIWDLREDDLIAHTFEQFLETGDLEWPLLVPMVRSVLAAMEALGEIAGIQQFIVGGASKRGWTSWLAAATGDKRIRGIVPIVFDNLKMDRQMIRQTELWGEPSEMVNDYVRRQLHLISESERGEELVNLVDPIRQIHDIHCPALVINGANDAYWAVDALNLYYSDLPGGSAAVVVPNLGHSTGNRLFWGPALNRFGKFVFGNGDWPVVKSSWADNQMAYSVSSGEYKIHVWKAESKDLKFWDSSWEKVSTGWQDDGRTVTVEAPIVNHFAYFVEFEFKDEDGFWRLTSPANVLES